MTEKYFLLDGKSSEIISARLLKDPKALKALSNPLGWKIFQSLGSPQCPIDLARNLGIHEQKVYYYINKFRKSGLLEEVKRETRHGTLARFYRVKDYSLAIKLDRAKREKLEIKSPVYKKGLEPFIKNGKINFTIIVGSPDPHGPWKARASDGSCAIDLALFLGSFTKGNGIPNYKLDTEIRDRDLKNNLIIVGGPMVNMITKKLNKRLPIFIDPKTKDIVSKVSKRVYKHEESGFISLIENPWRKDRKILVFAGNRFPGTRATILAFVKDMEKILEGNRFDKDIKSRVVRGFDMNGDGTIDTAEIRE